MNDHEEVNDPKETLEIQNVVASTAVGQELDLQSLAMDLEGADFDREQLAVVQKSSHTLRYLISICREGRFHVSASRYGPEHPRSLSK